MGLIRKQPITYTQKLFTVGLNKTILIVGLGNVGKDYDKTRHNVGFMVLDRFKEENDFPNWENKTSLKCEISMSQLGETRVVLVKPTTFMNLSGTAVALVMNYFKIPQENLLVIHDELDINYGIIRTTNGGSSAGHNGIKSIIEKVGKDFGRVRIGIGPKTPPQIDSADFVLGKFSSKESEKLSEVIKEATVVITERIYSERLNQETRPVFV